MIAQAHAATVLGIEAHPITVEVDVAIGLSAFNIVGLPDNTIRESRDRILAALSNCGFALPPRKIVVNLAPAQLKKVGAGFDLLHFYLASRKQSCDKIAFATRLAFNSYTSSSGHLLEL